MEKSNDELIDEELSLVPRSNNDIPSTLYQNDSLVVSLSLTRERRLQALSKNDIIGKSVKSNSSYLKTLLVIRERAIDVFFFPWAIVTINAIVWTCLIEGPLKDKFIIEPETVNSLYTLVLTTTLAFLLVFRLNRVAVRWWETRRMWGSIIANSRTLAGAILEHMNHAPDHRDAALSYVAAYAVACKHHIRNEKKYDPNELAGFLSPEQVRILSSSNHPCLLAAAKLRHALQLAFQVSPATKAAVGSAYSSEMRMMEKHIFNLINEMGGLERVRSSPLPIVYVTHLRTFLMIYLLSMPYLYGHTWGYFTIPAVTLTGFALLGIDGAATECSSPFNKSRANHLDMDGFCLIILKELEMLAGLNTDIQKEE
jgi:putative membrane protein